ncbi:ethanolamine ammonia-lyase subunit EutC [Thalassolituus sp. LLYu03]|uniref:ethanolamine ammonia-lyase subunit EutC n=1 Tax=Thalassolituus sp. LLYu03 TaxID=3421656 RepID=UPI003D2D5F63
MAERDNSPVTDDWNGVTDNPWRRLRMFTDARIGLGRSGVSIPTDELLQFQLAHAQARDAVHTPLDATTLAEQIQQLAQEFGQLNRAEPFLLCSEAGERRTYLQRPDLGRRLSEQDRSLLLQSGHKPQAVSDLAIVIADGLSARAISENAVPFLRALLTEFAEKKSTLTLAPLALVQQGRVAVGDDVGELLNARAVLVMIGERPGLSSPDSMGLYLTWAPQRGLTDDKRNCISNVRKAGLMYDEAARKLLYLLTEAQRLQGSGVILKDRSDDALIEGSESSTSFLLQQ